MSFILLLLKGRLKNIQNRFSKLTSWFCIVNLTLSLKRTSQNPKKLWKPFSFFLQSWKNNHAVCYKRKTVVILKRSSYGVDWAIRTCYSAWDILFWRVIFEEIRAETKFGNRSNFKNKLLRKALLFLSKANNCKK